MLNNNVTLIGRLTADPELKETKNGTAVMQATIAVERMKRDGEDQGADFINLVIWSHSADYISKYANKGDLIGVNGRLSQRTYENKDGNTVWVVEVVCDTVEILRKVAQQETKASPAKKSNNRRSSELPF